MAYRVVSRDRLARRGIQAAASWLSCGAVGLESQLCRSWGKGMGGADRGGHEVKIISGPKETNERLALYHQWFAFWAINNPRKRKKQ
ncbi:MAG: hypothetical protein ABFS45_27520 [Pseudomonadota bacterium]